jgi:transcription elongation factor GreA
LEYHTSCDDQESNESCEEAEALDAIASAPIVWISRTRSVAVETGRKSPICRDGILLASARKDGKEPAMSDPLANIKKKLQDEITALELELNLELPKELMKARAHGDLSENAEYKYAKERQGFVSARLGQLKKRMGDMGMLNLSNIPTDRAGYGSQVKLRDLGKDIDIEYKLVTSEEADASLGLISTTSPIGKALLGRRVGDEVKVQTPAGVKEFEVITLRTIHEE